MQCEIPSACQIIVGNKCNDNKNNNHINTSTYSNSGTNNSSGNNRISLSWAQLSAIRGISSGPVEACKENLSGQLPKKL